MSRICKTRVGAGVRSRATKRSLVKRLGVIAVTATTAVLLPASPALALEDIEIKDVDLRAYMIFHDNGDTFQVCDTRVDGGGVRGKLFYKAIGGSWYVSDSASDGDGGPACSKFASDVNNVGDYQMKLYWLGTGIEKEVAKSRVFNE